MDERPASLKLIQWICFSVRPLSLDELRWAMIIDADCPNKSLQECKNTEDHISDSDRMNRRVQTLSCGLVEVTSDAKVVQFIHQSVKDFFTEKGLSAMNETTNPSIIVGYAHHRLSRTCIRYLTMDEVARSVGQEPDHLKSEFTFLHYATTSWVAHMKESDARSVPQEDLLQYFTGPSNTLMKRWVCIYGLLKRYFDDCLPEGTSLVHVMSRYGVVGALGVILGRADQVGIDIDGEDSDGRTPLWWAAERGHEAVVHLLLEWSASVEAADKDGRTPLWWASLEGHEAIVRLLLDQNADTDAAGKNGQTPLWLTALKGHKDIVRLLIERNASIEAADRWWGRTSLLCAAVQGHEVVVRLLLDRGAHTEVADKWERRTSLWRTAENGHDAIMRLLLDQGADTESANKDGRTPLLMAAAWGHEVTVRLLLTRDASIEAADKWGQTPLSWAAKRGHDAVVRLLLDRGTYTEVADKDG
ncbi:ankyrin repeat domain-containing protein [Fusarium coicis]|nr:ankyrin repeat domain-containing protein [Fusarium coicis]